MSSNKKEGIKERAKMFEENGKQENKKEEEEKKKKEEKEKKKKEEEDKKKKEISGESNKEDNQKKNEMTSDENASKDNNIKENKQNNKENEEGNKNDSLKKEKNNNPNNEGENQNTHPIKENEKTGESEKKNEKENKDDNKNDNGNEQKDTSKNNENPQKVDINDKKKTNNKKYKEIPIIAHESEKPSIAFEEIDAGKLYSSIPVSNSIPQNSPQDINDNNQNNASNQNNNNNIFNPELFQQFWQQYLLQHGFENNFVNNYFNLDAFMLSDEEKKIIDYYRKSENCGLPNTLNGCIILNTKNHSLGLQNVGATCYMNATLQCLIHIRELSEVLLSAFSFKYPREDINYAQNHRLSLEYINILSQVYFPKLYDASAICFAPYKFKELIGELNPLFNGYAANDAKDLLQFILETMHQELKMAVQPFMEYYCNQTQEYLAYQYFIDSYVSQNQSPLLKFLYGITKIQTECLKCKTVKYNFQSYNLLYFPLRESKWYCVEKKKQENKDFDETKYILDLDGCFMYNEKVDHFTGDNQMYCSICKGCQDSDYKSFIYSAPPILAIVLNRGRGNKDFQEPFKYSVDIDISNYLKNGQNGKYYLIGMVVHLGESSMAGHFIAYCRMDKESDWYCYNDAFVSKCSNFDEIVEKGTPYILFYRQEDQNQTQNPIQNPIQNQNQIQNQK